MGDVIVISHDTLIRNRNDIALDINTILCLEDRRIIGTVCIIPLFNMTRLLLFYIYYFII